MCVGLHSPIVTIGRLIVLNGVAKVDVNASACKVRSPGWEVRLHVKHDPAVGQGLANKSIGVRFCFASIGLHSGITITSINGDFWRGRQVDHLHIFVLKQMRELYFGDVAEAVFKLVVGRESRGEGNGERLA